nr:hypothetical protein BDOA9_0152040 [Bradyrhizobium sp. DOA9]
MRRSMSSARSPTLCSRCSSAKVVSMCRIAITLAVEVTMITASTNRKLPKVSWPMESEKVRLFSGGGVNSADIGNLRTGLLEIQYTTYCCPGGTCLGGRNIVNIGTAARFGFTTV